STAAADVPALRLQVDLSDRELRVMSGDTLVRTYEVAIGTRSHPTPQGIYRIDSVIWNPWWGPPDRDWARGKRRMPPGHPRNPMQVVKIPFDAPYYYIHGTDRPGSVGKAASHGCVRMRPDEAAELARLLMDHAGEIRDDEWYEEIRESDDTTEVELPRSVEIVIVD
ncbi:MAG: L,D-transpeptidase, partial [Thermoanaerobaculia bacterium]